MDGSCVLWSDEGSSASSTVDVDGDTGPPVGRSSMSVLGWSMISEGYAGGNRRRQGGARSRAEGQT